MKVTDFKIIIKAKKVPVNINNGIIDYVQDNSRPNNHLYCEVFFQKSLIAQGIVLDFYKNFEILEDFNQKLFTHILTFEHHDRHYPSYTSFGNNVYKMKYLKNPSIKSETRETYTNEMISHFNGYITSLKKDYTHLNLTFIPSSSQIPDEIAYRLSEINTIPLCNSISKKTTLSSKSMTTLEQQSFDKYHLNMTNLQTDAKVLLIDDVMGTGASVCETMAKLYQFNQKINYFFIVVKDVKR